MALRLTPARQKALLALRRAGQAGIAVVVCIDDAMPVSLFTAHGLAEEFEDHQAWSPQRARLTPFGERVVDTLILERTDAA